MSISTILETNILSIYINAVKAFPLKLSMRIPKFSPETTHILCIFFALVCMIPFLFFCVRVQFFWRRSLETDIKELHKPPVKKANSFKQTRY